MKVYIRRWRKGERNYVQEGSHEIDAYNGLVFGLKGDLESVTVRSIFLHAGEKNALVVYVEDVK
jgi:hypothetical protein